MEISTVPIIFVRALQEAANRQGCTTDDLLQQVNLAPELLQQIVERGLQLYAEHREIIEAMEGPVKLDRCVLSRAPCPAEEPIVPVVEQQQHEW